MNRESHNQTIQHAADLFAAQHWKDLGLTSSIETLQHPVDKYELANFAHEDFPRFLSLVNLLSPRDAEIMLCFAILEKRPTDLSILFGKAGHRAEEDLHKAAHKLAGLIEFGPLPAHRRIAEILRRERCEAWDGGSFAVALRAYARCRNFSRTARGLRQQMRRVFRTLHNSPGRDEGLLAGWILWLVDGSEPHGKGWRQPKRGTRDHKLGPTVFRTLKSGIAQLQEARRATQKGGLRQRTANVKLHRHLKFLLRGMNG